MTPSDAEEWVRILSVDGERRLRSRQLVFLGGLSALVIGVAITDKTTSAGADVAVAVVTLSVAGLLLAYFRRKLSQEAGVEFSEVGLRFHKHSEPSVVRWADVRAVARNDFGALYIDTAYSRLVVSQSTAADWARLIDVIERRVPIARTQPAV